MADLVTNALELTAELASMLGEARQLLDVIAQRYPPLVRNDDSGYGAGAGGEPERWITVKGQHIPIYKGESVGDSIERHFSNLRDKGGSHGQAKDAGGVQHGGQGAHGAAGQHDEHGHGAAAEHGHGEHGAHGHDPLEHAGHQAHAAQDLATIHEAFGGGHAAAAAVHGAHEAAEAAHAAHGVSEAAHAAHGAAEAGHAAEHAAHGATPLDAAAIAARHLYGPMAKAAGSLLGKVPGLRRFGAAIKAVHEKATALNQQLTEKLVERYGKATAGAILGVGSAMSHTVGHGIGLHGPGANALPGPHLIGAAPLIAAAEVGKRLGLVGDGTKLEKGLGVLGAGLHGLMSAVGKAAGKVTEKVASAGLKGAHAAGKLTGKVIRGAKRLTGNELTELVLATNSIVIDADSLDVWNVGGQFWQPIDDLLPHLALTDNELTEMMEMVVNAEVEDYTHAAP